MKKRKELTLLNSFCKHPSDHLKQAGFLIDCDLEICGSWIKENRSYYETYKLMSNRKRTEFSLLPL